MKKQSFYLIGGIPLVAGILFGMKTFRDTYLPIPVPPCPEWEHYVSGLDAQRESFFVDSDGRHGFLHVL